MPKVGRAARLDGILGTVLCDVGAVVGNEGIATVSAATASVMKLFEVPAVSRIQHVAVVAQE